VQRYKKNGNEKRKMQKNLLVTKNVRIFATEFSLLLKLILWIEEKRYASSCLSKREKFQEHTRWHSVLPRYLARDGVTISLCNGFLTTSREREGHTVLRF
jgi:hypothetical protein